MFVAAAILGGAAIGGVTSLIGAHQQSSAARRSADLQMDQFGIQNQQQQPFIQGGYSAQQRLMQLLGLGGQPGGGAPLSFEDWSTQNPQLSTPSGGGMSQLLHRGMAAGDQRAQYDQYVKDFKPGADSESSDYGSLLQPFGADEFKKFLDPGYQFRRQQGEQSVLNSASAGSGAMSGAALKDLLSFNSDLASTEYGNAFNRYQTQQGNIFQRLAGLTQLGQGAAANVGSQGTALAGQAGQALQNAGTAAGAGTVGAGNAIAGGASNYWLSQMLKGP